MPSIFNYSETRQIASLVSELVPYYSEDGVEDFDAVLTQLVADTQQDKLFIPGQLVYLNTIVNGVSMGQTPLIILSTNRSRRRGATLQITGFLLVGDLTNPTFATLPIDVEADATNPILTAVASDNTIQTEILASFLGLGSVRAIKDKFRIKSLLILSDDKETFESYH